VGLARAAIRLADARRSDLAAIDVKAPADTGEIHLCIPEHIALQLQLEEREKREVIADGSKRLVPYVGGDGVVRQPAFFYRRRGAGK
jgi:hypothetical protein